MVVCRGSCRDSSGYIHLPAVWHANLAVCTRCTGGAIGTETADGAGIEGRRWFLDRFFGECVRQGYPANHDDHLVFYRQIEEDKPKGQPRLSFLLLPLLVNEAIDANHFSENRYLF